MRIALRHFSYPKGRLKPNIVDKPVIFTSSPVSKRGSSSNLNSAIEFQRSCILPLVKLVYLLLVLQALITYSNV